MKAHFTDQLWVENRPNNIKSYPTLARRKRLLTATIAHTMSRRCLVHWMELTFPYFPPAAGYRGKFILNQVHRLAYNKLGRETTHRNHR